MRCPRFDFHIHTKYLGCANHTMEVGAILRESKRLGVTALALTDHLNTLDKLPLHGPIVEDIRRESGIGVQVYFGVELNFTGPEEGFAFSREVKEAYGFQFAIGGIHSTYLQQYDLDQLIEVQHRHHLRTCEDPLVDVLVHPYWFSKGEFDRQNWPWFDSMAVVPQRYVRELGQASRDTGTAIEINGKANLQNPSFGPRYVEEYYYFLQLLAAEGAIFTCGSDAHDIRHLGAIQECWACAERLGLRDEQIWRPAVEPVVS